MSDVMCGVVYVVMDGVDVFGTHGGVDDVVVVYIVVCVDVVVVYVICGECVVVVTILWLNAAS